MHMDIVTRMLRQDVDRALFVAAVPGAHPEQQPAMFKLVLQVFGVPVTHQSGHPGAQRAPCPAQKRSRLTYRAHLRLPLLSWLPDNRAVWAQKINYCQK